MNPIDRIESGLIALRRKEMPVSTPGFQKSGPHGGEAGGPRDGAKTTTARKQPARCRGVDQFLCHNPLVRCCRFFQLDLILRDDSTQPNSNRRAGFIRRRENCKITGSEGVSPAWGANRGHTAFWGGKVVNRGGRDARAPKKNLAILLRVHQERQEYSSPIWTGSRKDAIVRAIL